MAENLMDGVLSEMNRVRELITEYESLPKGAGLFGAAIMRISIKNAEIAISQGDVIKLLQSYSDLQSHEG